MFCNLGFAEIQQGINLNIAYHAINGRADNRCNKQRKNVGANDENNAANQIQTIFVQIFIEIK